MERVVKRAFFDAIGTFAYVVLVALFMSYLQGFAPEEDTILSAVPFLLLFVCSAAITGFLVFGKPVMLYLDGKKKESVLLLGYTLGVLFVITLVSFAFVILYNLS